MNPTQIAKQLKDKGQPMTLTRQGVGSTNNLITGAVTGGIPTTYDVNGITTTYKTGNINVPDSMILSGDKKAIIGAGIIEPKPADTLTIMGVDWTIIAVDELSPQGVVLMYTCQVRK